MELDYRYVAAGLLFGFVVATVAYLHVCTVLANKRKRELRELRTTMPFDCSFHYTDKVNLGNDCLIYLQKQYNERISNQMQLEQKDQGGNHGG